MTPKGHHIHWLYLWLAISAAGNIIGMASLVEGLVTWADFFKHIIELYRDNIRAPVAWVGNHLWSFGKIPEVFFDGIIAWGIFLLAANLATITVKKRTFFSELWAGPIRVRDKVILTAVIMIAFLPPFNFFLWAAFLTEPIELLVKTNKTHAEKEDAKMFIALYSYSLAIVTIFIIILLINYQVLKLQAPH
jgi:hypothetical protein